MTNNKEYPIAKKYPFKNSFYFISSLDCLYSIKKLIIYSIFSELRSK